MSEHSHSKANRIGVFAYGATVYVLFLGTFLYAIGFIADMFVPKGINDGEVGAFVPSILVNASILSLFAVQHTIMARPAFKEWFTRVVPRAAERSTFVLATCLILCTLFWQWRPLPEIVWQVDSIAGRALLHALFAMGFALVLYSTFCIDHFDLFGLRQVWLHLRGFHYTHPGFAQPVIYRLVRNPLMLGFLVAFWSAPTMTQGRLAFALLTTGYILIGVQFEENDLLKMLGDDYRDYRARTPMLIPFLKFRRPKAQVGAATPV